MDSLDADIERMRRINHTVTETKEKEVEYKDTKLRQIDYLVVSPSRDIREIVEKYVGNFPRTLKSRDIREIVEKYVGNFPRTLKILLKGIGALAREGRPLMSYLMFDAPYCKELMEMGYEDGMAAREQILHLLGQDELIEKADAG